MKEIDNILRKQVENKHTPSIQYLLFGTDKIIHRFHAGYAAVGRELKASEQTVYHAFSVTKTFTALAVLQLAERQQLDIDQPASRYLSDFPYGSVITVRHLLAHTAGIANPIPIRWIHLKEEHASFDRNNFFDEVFRKNPKVKSPPDENCAYTNLGYILLGRLIEQVSAMSYENYIRKHILQPLGLTDADISFELPGNAPEATGYHPRMSLSYLLLGFMLDRSKYMGEAEGTWKPFKSFYINGTSYGGLFCTASALARYGQELLKPGCVLISDPFKQQLFTEHRTRNHRGTGMSLSWFKGSLMGRDYFTHAGGGGGFYCELRLYPAEGIGSVMMMNRTGMRDERFLDQVDRLYWNS